MNNKTTDAEKFEKKTPMTAKEWEPIIAEQCGKLGFMDEPFVPVIESLAKILEQRDQVYQEFLEQGGHVTVKKTSDRGSENMAKNPLYVIWNELNTQALAYWRELGCTPRSVIAIEKKNTEMWRGLIQELHEVEKAYVEEVRLMVDQVDEQYSGMSPNKSDVSKQH